MTPECSVVVPVYNEEQTLPRLNLRLVATLCRLAIPYEIIYVDDGSNDRTTELIKEMHRDNSAVKGIFLSRNFGHQSALCAGLEAARGRAVVSIDGDLQDPPELIPDLIDKWHEGYQVVYARRRRRKESPFKLVACYIFYRILRWLSDTPIALDTGDFVLMDRQVVEQLNSMPERTRFVRGLRGWIGFKQTEVEYNRDPRREGESKYPFKRLLRLALDGIVGFSDVPLKAITLLGCLVCLLAVLGLIASIVGINVFGAYWTWMAGIASALVLVGGIQMLCLGVIGEYMSRVYHEVRGRPLYIIRERLGLQSRIRPVPEVLKFFPSETATQQELAIASRHGEDWSRNPVPSPSEQNT